MSMEKKNHIGKIWPFKADSYIAHHPQVTSNKYLSAPVTDSKLSVQLISGSNNACFL